MPTGFPRSATWIAIAAGDDVPVSARLQLRTVLPANWTAGLAQARTEGVFVTPPIDGWVLVTGADLTRLARDPDGVPGLLQQLARGTGRAAWFHCDEDADEYGWALAEAGEIVRAYAYRGEHDHVLWQGEVTAAEHALDCYRDDPRDRSDDEVKWWPDRRHVHAMAAAWSIDPDTLPQYRLPPSCGIVGRL